MTIAIYPSGPDTDSGGGDDDYYSTSSSLLIILFVLFQRRLLYYYGTTVDGVPYPGKNTARMHIDRWLAAGTKRLHIAKICGAG